MCHQDHCSKLQLLDHRVQVALLILSRVWVARWLIGTAPPQKIKKHYSARRRKKGNKAIIKMKIVGKTMHQDDRRFFTCILSRVNPVLTSLHEMFREVHLHTPP